MARGSFLRISAVFPRREYARAIVSWIMRRPTLFSAFAEQIPRVDETPRVPPESQVFVSKRLAETEKNFPSKRFPNQVHRSK